MIHFSLSENPGTLMRRRLMLKIVQFIVELAVLFLFSNENIAHEKINYILIMSLHVWCNFIITYHKFGEFCRVRKNGTS